MKSIILGGGCFWCLEAVFQRVQGVAEVQSGYSGGHVDNPDYYAVCDERTGHAEVVQITYDSQQVRLDELLDIFFATHDPTTLNRQGHDVGPRYRSIAFYANDDEKLAIERAIERNSSDYPHPIVTKVEPVQSFWPAEDFHDDYYNQNTNQPYCQIVIGDKLKKLEKYMAKK